MCLTVRKARIFLQLKQKQNRTDPLFVCSATKIHPRGHKPFPLPSSPSISLPLPPFLPSFRTSSRSLPYPTENPIPSMHFPPSPNGAPYCFFLPFLRGCSNSGCPIVFVDGRDGLQSSKLLLLKMKKKYNANPPQDLTS